MRAVEEAVKAPSRRVRAGARWTARRATNPLRPPGLDELEGLLGDHLDTRVADRHGRQARQGHDRVLGPRGPRADLQDDHRLSADGDRPETGSPSAGSSKRSTRTPAADRGADLGGAGQDLGKVASASSSREAAHDRGHPRLAQDARTPRPTDRARSQPDATTRPSSSSMSLRRVAAALGPEVPGREVEALPRRRGRRAGAR